MTAATTVNKAQAIRDYIKEHPEAKNREVIDALAAQGINVKHTQISQARWTNKPKRRKAIRSSLPIAHNKPQEKLNGHIDINILTEAKTFAKNCGSVEQAKKVLEAFSGLIG